MTFFNNLHTFSNIAICQSDGKTISYKELAESADKLAANFNPNAKNIVLIYCKNSIETLIGYLAVLRSGNVALLVNNDIKHELAQNILDAYNPNYIWQENSGADSKIGFSLGNSILQVFSTTRDKPIHSNLALLLSTSGTTGSPQFVKLTSSNLQSNAQSIAQFLKIEESDRPITTLPFSYSYGLSIINSHLLKGATIYMTDDSIMTREFWSFYKSMQPTSIAGVPYTYEMLERLRFFNMDVSSLKTITQAGGKLPIERAKRFAEFSLERDINFVIMYGQTEATARISYVPPDRALEKHETIGIAIPEGTLKLYDSNDVMISENGKAGELVYTGPNVMMGYAKNRDDLATNDTLNGILKTGDIGMYDQDGYVIITGRIKRFIKLFGNRVNLDEIECILQGYGINCVCGGEDDQLIIATIKSTHTESLKKLVTELFKFHHSMYTIKIVPEIIRSESGKIQYSEMI